MRISDYAGGWADRRFHKAKGRTGEKELTGQVQRDPFGQNECAKVKAPKCRKF